MAAPVHIEVVGLKTSECSPFPCDEERTCGLSGCYPAGTLNDAFGELQNVLHKTYGNRVECKLTLIDEGAPAPIRTIIEQEFPPIPMILVNGRVTRIGRIALDRIMKEIEKELWYAGPAGGGVRCRPSLHLVTANNIMRTRRS